MTSQNIVFQLHKIFEKYYEVGLVKEISRDDVTEFNLCFDKASIEELHNDSDFIDISVGSDINFVLSKNIPEIGLVSMLVHSWAQESYSFKFRHGPAKMTHREEPYRFFYEECDVVELDGGPAESSQGTLRTVHNIVTNEKRRDTEKYWPEDIIILPDFKNAMKFFQDDNSYDPFKICTPRNIFYCDTDVDNNTVLVRLTDTQTKKIATCTWADIGPGYYVQKCPEMCEELINRGYVMNSYGRRRGGPAAAAADYDRKKSISSIKRDDPNLIELLEDPAYKDCCTEVDIMEVPEHAITTYRNRGDYEIVESYLKLF
jgi:hypothetical protein